MALRPILLLVSALALGLAAPALASDDVEDEQKSAPHENVHLSFWFDDETGLVLYGTTGGDEPVECDPMDDVPTVTDAGEVEGDLPEGCMALVIEASDDEINHGNVVSQSISALKDMRSELDGPFGQYVRLIAQSDAGKNGDDGDDADEGDEAEDADEGDEGDGPPDHAPAHGQSTSDGEDPGNKDKKGPPAHAPAYGRNK